MLALNKKQTAHSSLAHVGLRDLTEEEIHFVSGGGAVDGSVDGSDGNGSVGAGVGDSCGDSGCGDGGTD